MMKQFIFFTEVYKYQTRKRNFISIVLLKCKGFKTRQMELEGNIECIDNDEGYM